MPDQLKPPIILLGNFRSGTTMLQKLIAAHPDVVALYEPVGLWLYADPGRPHDEFDESDATPRVKDYIRSQFLKHQQAHGDRVIVEKTPHNILRIAYVREIFPEARFLYLVRNPLSFLSSVELKWQKPAGRRQILKRIRSTPVSQLHKYLGRFVSQQWNNRILGKKYVSVWGPRYAGIQDDLRSGNLLRVIARQWAKASAKAERELALFGKGQVLRLRYEDLVLDPVRELQRICIHCGLEMTGEMALAARELVRDARQEKWRRFEPAELAALVPELAAEMARHRYTIPPELVGPSRRSAAPPPRPRKKEARQSRRRS